MEDIHVHHIPSFADWWRSSRMKLPFHPSSPISSISSNTSTGSSGSGRSKNLSRRLYSQNVPQSPSYSGPAWTVIHAVVFPLLPTTHVSLPSMDEQIARQRTNDRVMVIGLPGLSDSSHTSLLTRMRAYTTGWKGNVDRKSSGLSTGWERKMTIKSCDQMGRISDE